MKYWYILLLSLIFTLVLFTLISTFLNRREMKRVDFEEPIQIVLKSKTGNSMDFWGVIIQGLTHASQEFSLPIEITGPLLETDIDEQIEIVNQIISKRKPPLIVLSASDYQKLVPMVQKAHSFGIPVITLDSGVDSNLPISFIATDNKTAGRKAAKEMRRLLQGRQGSIAIISPIREATSAIDRESGVREEFGDEYIIGTWFCNVNSQIAYEQTKMIVQSHEVKGLIALNEIASLGVARALEELNLYDEIQLVAFDNSLEELSYLEQGVIKATIVQRPYNMGYLSLKTAYELLIGGSVEAFVDTGSVVINKENMFKREYQELLFPFSSTQ